LGELLKKFPQTPSKLSTQKIVLYRERFFLLSFFASFFEKAEQKLLLSKKKIVRSIKTFAFEEKKSFA